MAVHITEVQEQVVVAPTGLQGFRVAWGGIWSGFLFALGVFLLLSVLGMAIGISTADIGTPNGTSARSIGIGASVWSAVTLLIALFVGGWAATRSSMVHDGTAGMIEGVLVWVLSVLSLIYMAGSGVSLLASGVFGSIGTVTQGAVAAVRTVDVDAITQGDASQISSRLNDSKTIALVSGATGMPEAEARAKLAEIAAKVDVAKDDPARAADDARQGLKDLGSRAAARAEQAAARAQPYASATMWMTLASMVLGLIAALAGAMIGRRQVAARLMNEATFNRPVQT